MSKYYDIVLLDADETVYDFSLAEKTAITKTLSAFGVEVDERVLKLYSEGNLWCWKALEKGEITREKLKSLRFEMLFQKISAKIPDDFDFLALNSMYERELSFCGFMLPGGLEFVQKLHKYYDVKIYLATNGLTIPQTGRFKRSGIAPYVDGIYISEQVGASKPEKAYFDHIFADLGVKDRKRVIILGDSLTSDMQGGRNAGIATCCFLGKRPATGSELCDYEIHDYDEFFSIIE